MKLRRESVIAFCFWALYVPISLTVLYDPALAKVGRLVNVFMIGIIIVAAYLTCSYLIHRPKTETEQEDISEEETKEQKGEETQQDEPSLPILHGVFEEDFGKNQGGCEK